MNNKDIIEAVKRDIDSAVLILLGAGEPVARNNNDGSTTVTFPVKKYNVEVTSRELNDERYHLKITDANANVLIDKKTTDDDLQDDLLSVVDPGFKERIHEQTEEIDSRSAQH